MPTIKNTDNASTGEDVEQQICLRGDAKCTVKMVQFKKFLKNKMYIYHDD